MNVAILHDRITTDSRPDQVDALHQAALVETALVHLGHEVATFPVDLNLAELEDTLRDSRPDLVFNLVESLGGHGRLLHMLPAVLEALDIPFTGSGSHALLLTTSKLLTKQRLIQAGVATPPWAGMSASETVPLDFPCTCIIKPVWEDASVGIDDAAVVKVASPAALERALADASARHGAVFAEEFITGREFNLSILGGADQPEVLPPAEIVFVGFPAGKPQIVGYPAKWEADSFEYQATQRRFDFPRGDQALLADLRAVALACWTQFGLGGYARVDFRVDESLRPWVLEVNANPCLAPDAGFMAAAAESGLSAEEVIARIVGDTFMTSPTARAVPHAAHSPRL